MATRRSRIKAVANLPARRNRPAANSDVKKEDADSPEDALEDLRVSSNSPQSNNSSEIPGEKDSGNVVQCSDSENSAEPHVINIDRKSVIVSVEKDRKSVIVNRSIDHGHDSASAGLDAESITGVKVSSHELGKTNRSKSELDKITSREKTEAKGGNKLVEKQDKSLRDGPSLEVTSQSPKKVPNQPQPETHFEEKNGTVVISTNPSREKSCQQQSDENPAHSADSASEDNSSQNNPVVSIEGNSEICPTPNIRGPFRGRRSKPVVNLTAASRKRPAPDSGSFSSPKTRAQDAIHHSSSEGDNDCETKAAPDCGEKSMVDHIKDDSSKAQPLPMLMSPPPVPVLPAGNLLSPLSSNTKSREVPNGTESSSATGSVPPTTPKDLGSVTKRKQSTSALKAAAARKNFKSRFSADRPPPRSALTMFDLIFYNPSKNPMKSSGPPSSVKSRSRQTSISSISSVHEERLNEEAVDDLEGDKSVDGNDKEEQEETAMPVPRVKVGPDGSLILDEQSLVIETTGAKKIREELERSEVIIDTGSSYGHYKTTKRSKDWSDNETKKFYRALNVVGTDFSLMKPLFRNRTRRELKLKFKKEERLNPSLVNKALNEHLDFDVTELEKECALEEEEEKRLETVTKEKDTSGKESDTPNQKLIRPKKKPRGKRSRLSIEIESDNQEEVDSAKDEAPSVPDLPKKPPKKKTKRTLADEDYELLSKGVDLVDSHEKKILRTQPTRTKKKPPIILDIEEDDSDEAVKSSHRSNEHPKPKSPQPTRTTCKTSEIADQISIDDTMCVDAMNTGEQSHSHGPKTRNTLIGFQEKSSNIIKVPTPTLFSLTSSPTAAKPASTGTFVQKIVTSPTLSLCSPTPTSAKLACVGTPIQRVMPSLAVSSTSPSTSAKLAPVGTPIRKIVASPTLSSSSSSPTVIKPAIVGTPIQKIVAAPTLSSSTSSPSVVRPVTVGTPIQKIVASPTLSLSTSSPRVVKPATLGTPVQKILAIPALSSSTSSPTSAKPVTVETPTRKTVYRIVPSVTTPPSQQHIIAHASPQTPAGITAGGTAFTTPVSRFLPSPNLPRMEPGSLIVLKTPIPENPERHILQVYMVTNKPPATNSPQAPHTSIVPSITPLPAPSATLAKSTSSIPNSDSEKVLTTL